MRPLSTLLCLVFAAPSTLAFQQGEFAKLLASDGQANDLFGRAVAIDGDIAVVGAFSDDGPGSEAGSAYLFNTTTGQELTKLLPNDAASGDQFGFAVAIEGNVTVVGAPFDDDNGLTSGSVYLFDTGTGLQTAKLVALDGVENDQFGTSVAIVGTTVLVGAPWVNTVGTNAGSAYVFDAVSGNQTLKLIPNDPAAHDGFGRAVAASGSMALISAPTKDVTWFNSGSCYTFDLNTGNQLARFEGVSPGPNQFFGAAVALEGPLALIGAYGTDGSGIDSGSAHLHNAHTGIQLLKLTAPDASSGDMFGVSVATEGSMAVVGAFSDDDNGSFSGSAYMINLATGETVQKLLPSDGGAFKEFGYALAISGTTAIVGSAWDDDNGQGTGSAYLFDIPAASGGNFCSGDGSAAACPCGANGNADEGCLNSSSATGASLLGQGLASISNDSFWLFVGGRARGQARLDPARIQPTPVRRRGLSRGPFSTCRGVPFQ